MGPSGSAGSVAKGITELSPRRKSVFNSTLRRLNPQSKTSSPSRLSFAFKTKMLSPVSTSSSTRAPSSPGISPGLIKASVPTLRRSSASTAGDLSPSFHDISEITKVPSVPFLSETLLSGPSGIVSSSSATLNSAVASKIGGAWGEISSS